MVRSRQQGFTLFELLIVVSIAIILAAFVSPQLDMISGLRRSTEATYQSQLNRVISQTTLRWADTFNGGTLPTPTTDTGAHLYAALFNPGDTSANNQALSDLLDREGVSPKEFNGDGKPSANVRVYQWVPDLQIQVPFAGAAGPQVTLNYDFGVLYNTRCPVTDTSCNPNSTTGVPGDSPALDGTNITTWDVSGQDYGVVRFSTLGLQRDRLAQTATRINIVRSALRDMFNALQLSGDPTSQQNYFPVPNGPGSPNLSAQNPTTNQGCIDGWYNLAATNVNVLAQMGLSQTEFGVTAWGGTVEYCRDFQPTATSAASAGQPPHAAALRVNATASLGLPPGSSAAANVFFTI